MNALKGVARLRAPLLILGSRQDPYLTVPDARRLLRRAGSKDKRLVLYPAAFHGWQIVEEAPYASRARALVLAWIRARTP
jgi:alpha-beta hydrolase superfamily lysophospholipase